MLHKDSSSRCSPSTSPEHSTSFIPRRLVGSKPSQTPFMPRSREVSPSFSFTRVHSKQGKVRTCAQTGNHLHRGTVPFEPRGSHSNTRQGKKVSFCCEQDMQRPQPSQGFFTYSGHNGIMFRTNPKCSPLHETHSVASASFLETFISRSRGFNSSYSTSKMSSAMVVKSSEHHERQIVTTRPYGCNHNNRCFEMGLRRTLGKTLFSRPMVRVPAETTYQLSGVGGCLSNSQTFPISGERQKCPDKVRQYLCSTTDFETRGNKISSTVLQNMGFMEFCHSKQHSFEGCSHIGGSERTCRPVEQEKGHGNRMVSPQVSCPSNISDLGVSINRPVCLGRESSDSDFLLMDSTSRSFSTGCPVNFMGKHVRVCIPSNLSDPKGSTTHNPISVSDYSDCATVASQTLVYTASTASGCLPQEASSQGRFTASTQSINTSPKSRGFQSSCLAVIDRNFQKKGFSSQSRKLLSASWRAGTQKDYAGKFNKFCSWCSSKQIDPYSATLTQIADFLSELFDNGLQYRTIAGYRSMLSAVLQPIDNFSVGQHPFIIRLLKGVFNSRPPKVKILPEWDLPLVLQMLQETPFEPLSKASLKFTTFKTIFLMAICTFRRCSDLQSLCLGEGAVCVQKKGVTFVRQGLSKQDRQNHFGSKVFVPAFPENYKLDPKRALYWYLKKTDLVRVKSDGSREKKIFLALNKPHSPVSSQTISSWIVQTIRMAYNDENKKVKAHSTRAVGPSWALYNGASMRSILEAADWTKDSTFIQFYLRNVGVKVLK